MKSYALVTGASRGIGASCALSLAKEGLHVFLNARTVTDDLLSVHRKIEEAGGSSTLMPADVSDPRHVRSMFSAISKEAEGVDILVNNAGVSFIGLLTDMTDDDWDNIIQTNLSSVFYCCRSALPYMIRKKNGRIINISSMWGSAGASCEAAYSASKAGVNGLTKALAKELAPSRIPVNAIACGVIDTKMNACFSREEKAALMEEIPAGRFGSTDEVARLVTMLLHAPDYLTGQIIGMDGGYL